MDSTAEQLARRDRVRREMERRWTPAQRLLQFLESRAGAADLPGMSSEGRERFRRRNLRQRAIANRPQP